MGQGRIGVLGREQLLPERKGEGGAARGSTGQSRAVGVHVGRLWANALWTRLDRLSPGQGHPELPCPSPLLRGYAAGLLLRCTAGGHGLPGHKHRRQQEDGLTPQALGRSRGWGWGAGSAIVRPTGCRQQANTRVDFPSLPPSMGWRRWEVLTGSRPAIIPLTCRLPGFRDSGKANSRHTDTVYHHKGKQ